MIKQQYIPHVTDPRQAKYVMRVISNVSCKITWTQSLVQAVTNAPRFN